MSWVRGRIDGHDLLTIGGLLALNVGLVLVWSAGIALIVTGVLLLGAAAWGMR